MSRLGPLPATILLAAAFACGRNGPAPHPAGPTGPPRWQAAPGSAASGEQAVLLHVRSPARVRIRAEGFVEPGRRRTLATLDLAAGRTVRIAWEARSAALPADAGHPAGRGGGEDGRSAGHAVAMRAEVDGTASYAAEDVTWTRPERGRVLETSALPPARAEDLAFGQDVELAAVAVVDARTPEVSLRRREGRSRIRMTDPRPGDRGRLYRLLLELERR